MRLVALLFLTLALATPVAAQANETSNETATNETPANESATEEAPAEEGAGPVTIELEAHTQGGSGYFTLPGETAKNPRISVKPGQQVTIVLKGTDVGFHNFCVADKDTCTDYVQAPGETGTITFTAPESGTVEYFCFPHRGAGMKGVIVVGDAPVEGGGETGGAEGEITGDTIDLGTYSPDCAGKKAPASVADGVVGAPTLDDYIKACSASSSGGGTTEVRAKSGADLVIPISWGLIFVGVAGVVWAHKYYKP